MAHKFRCAHTHTLILFHTLTHVETRDHLLQHAILSRIHMSLLCVSVSPECCLSIHWSISRLPIFSLCPFWLGKAISPFLTFSFTCYSFFFPFCFTFSFQPLPTFTFFCESFESLSLYLSAKLPSLCPRLNAQPREKWMCLFELNHIPPERPQMSMRRRMCLFLVCAVSILFDCFCFSASLSGLASRHYHTMLRCTTTMPTFWRIEQEARRPFTTTKLLSGQYDSSAPVLLIFFSLSVDSVISLWTPIYSVMWCVFKDREKQRIFHWK